MTASSPERTVPKRVLIVASGRFEMGGDCYRRAIQETHEVHFVDPVELVQVTPPKWTGLSAMSISRVVTTASRLGLRDEFALAFPKIERIAREVQPDVVLVTHVDALPPKVIASLRGGNPRAKVIGVFSDAISNFGRGYFFASDYDALFFKDHYIVDKLRAKLGWNHVYYLPQSCDRHLHKPLELTAEDRATYGCDVTVAGNLHYFRAVQMGALLDRHDLKIWGVAPRWLDHPITKAHRGHEVFGDEKRKAMLAAAIVLNNNHYAEIDGTNKRTFEMAGMGAFQLTDTPALADVFVPNEEVATFDTHADMIEKVAYWLKRPEERAAMARRASERAHRDHTYEHRWAAHMFAIGLGVPASFAVQEADLRVRAV